MGKSRQVPAERDEEKKTLQTASPGLPREHVHMEKCVRREQQRVPGHHGSDRGAL